VLRDIQGFDYREIAAVTEVSARDRDVAARARQRLIRSIGAGE
jgi:DNA-directed RNA polymerase specialized sigma24 family protein